MNCFVDIDIGYPFCEKDEQTILQIMKEEMPCSPEFRLIKRNDYDDGCVGIRFYSGKCHERMARAIDHAVSRIPVYRRPRYMKGRVACSPVRWSRPSQDFLSYVERNGWKLTGSETIFDFDTMQENKELGCFFYFKDEILRTIQDRHDRPHESEGDDIMCDAREDSIEIICPNSCNTDYMGHIEIELFKEFQVDVRVTKADTAHHRVLLPERLNTNENVSKAIDIIKRIKKWYE